MADQPFAYYRLDSIDGASLPADLEYGDSRCRITDGDLVLRHDASLGGDGVVCMRLFGSAFGHPHIQQIFLEREPFDRLDETQLTFPGGWRRQHAIPPHFVARSTEDGLELTPLPATTAPSGAKHTFRAHRWSFVASEERLPNSDVAAG